jgi:hypothetical protein
MIYESRMKYCERLYKARKNGVFAPTFLDPSDSGEDLQKSNDGFFGWMTPAWEDIWIEIQSLKPGARLIEKQNRRYVHELAQR